MAVPGLLPDPEITAALANIDKDDARIVSVVEDVLHKLQAAKLAWSMRLPPNLVGVDPTNRSGYGISEIETHSLGADIVTMGWSFSATSHAVCIEDSPSGEVAAFTRQLRSANPGLGSELTEVKYGSLSCSHTNAFLVAALAEVPTEFPALSVDGRMSLAKLSQDVLLGDALKSGLTWLVLSHKVRVLYPTLTDLVQSARNAPGAAQRKESEVQLLVRMQRMATEQSKSSSGVVDWAGIGKVVARRTGDNAIVPVLLRYVQLYGGGERGLFISELNKFHQAHVPSGRVIPARTFQALVDLKLEPHELCPFVVNAVVKAQASGPKVDHGICNYVSSPDIAAPQGSRKITMLAAERVLVECRAVIKKAGVDEPLIGKCIGRLDTVMARFVMKKDAQFKSVEELGSKFVDEVNDTLAKLGKSCSPIVSPWSKPPGSGGAPPGDHPVQNIIQYDDSGRAIGAAKTHLQAEGALVACVV